MKANHHPRKRSICQVEDALRKLYQWHDTLPQDSPENLTQTETKEYLDRRKPIAEFQAALKKSTKLNESQPPAQRSICQVEDALHKLYQWHDTLPQDSPENLTETENERISGQTKTCCLNSRQRKKNLLSGTLLIGQKRWAAPF